MKKSDWHLITERPKKSGYYLVFALSADPKSPLRHLAWYQKDDLIIDGKVLTKADTWSGLVPMWMEALSHWAEFPPDPVKHRDTKGE